MSRPSRGELLVYLACAVAVVAVGIRALAASGGGSPGGDAPAAAGAKPAVRRAAEPAAMVHVAGAVRRPGVYRVAAGTRVQDAIRKAGGAAAGADLQAVNLAAKVTDAQQIVVPRKAPAITAAGSGGGTGASAGPGGAAPGPISLNTATAEQLETLDGVGPATARKILEYRAAKGGFGSVDELASVPGIGAKRLAALRAQVRV